MSRLLRHVGRKPLPPLLHLPLTGSLTGQDRGGVVAATGSGAVRYRAASGARVNYYSNGRMLPGFTLPGLNGAGSVVTTVNDASFQFGTAVEVNAPATSGFGANAQCFTIIPTTNQPITISLDAKWVSGGTDWKIVPSLRDATGGLINETLSSPITLTSTVQRFVYTFTPSAAAHGVHRINLKIGRVASSVGVCRFSNLVIEPGTNPTATYVDGAYPGAAWIEPNLGTVFAANSGPSVTTAAAWVEEATTNVVPDPIFGNATITTNWALSNVSTTATMVRDTTFSLFGQASLKAAFGANANDAISQLNTTSAAALVGQTWTVSASFRANTAADVGKTVRLTIMERDAAFAALVEGVVTVTLTDAWQRVTLTRTLANASTAFVSMRVLNGTGAVATALNIDGAQLEQKAYATSLAAGSLGTGYTWAGTANASTSTRAGAAALFGAENTRIKTEKGSAVVWLSRDYVSGSAAFPIILSIGAKVLGKDRFQFFLSNADANFYTVWNADGGTDRYSITGQSIPLGAWTMVYAEWNGSFQKAAVNLNALFNGANRDAPLGDLDATPDASIGATSTGGSAIDGLVGPVVIYDRPLTAAQRTRLFTLGPAATAWTSLTTPAVF